jgi:hypothetical protein
VLQSHPGFEAHRRVNVGCGPHGEMYPGLAAKNKDLRIHTYEIIDTTVEWEKYCQIAVNRNKSLREGRMKT